MPVDMVLAISHSRMTRERERNRLERLKKSERVLDNVVYSKHTDTGNDINIEKVKYQSCLEMFRLW